MLLLLYIHLQRADLAGLSVMGNERQAAPAVLQFNHPTPVVTAQVTGNTGTRPGTDLYSNGNTNAGAAAGKTTAVYSPGTAHDIESGGGSGGGDGGASGASGSSGVSASGIPIARSIPVRY